MVAILSGIRWLCFKGIMATVEYAAFSFCRNSAQIRFFMKINYRLLLVKVRM